ncbi:MAG: hypothetical protein IJJ26_02600 [Victivallales bacterium]|nr:hypothetical protein [Victivallales bacterium]
MKSGWIPFSLFTVIICACNLLAAPKNVTPSWVLYRHDKNAPGAQFALEDQRPDGYRMTIKRVQSNAKKVWALGITNINREMWTHNKVVLSVRALNENPVLFGVTVSTKEGTQIPMKSAKDIVVAGTSWRHIVLGLDTDFGLGDHRVTVVQLKLGCDVTGWKPGTKGGIEVKDVRICQPNEVTVSSSGRDEFYSIPAKELPVPVVAKDALKVYFHFDNEDIEDSWCPSRKIYDKQQFAGFRAMLLEGLDGKLVLADAPEKADLLVYSSCRPEPEMAKRLVSAVREKGIPLLVASEVADPEIHEILPCKITTESLSDFPKRQPVRFRDRKHPLAARGGYSGAAFGIYRDIVPNSGSKTVMEFADGTPLLVEGRAGKGRVFYDMLAIGAPVVPGKVAMDAFFVRLAGWICGKQLPEADLPAVRPDQDGWYVGASENNFGRFGWEVGNGLLVERLGGHLTVSMGSCEYEFSTVRKSKILMPLWNFASEKRKATQAWNTSWGEVGKVTLDAQVTIPSAWKERKIFFHVLKGIDDTAAVFFNGTKIGEITEKDPQYWMTEHRHEIPQDLIRYDQPNEVRIDSINIRGAGSLNSCPELITAEPPHVLTFAQDSIGFLGMGGILAVDDVKMARMDCSLAFPGVRWNVLLPEVHLSMYNLLGYAAIPTSKGVRVVGMKKLASLPLEDWSAPWILFFQGGRGDHPILIVFQHKLKALDVEVNGDALSGLGLRAAQGPVGVVVPLWLYGSRSIDATEWTKGLPQEVANRIAFWYPRAFQYPARCKEEFRIDAKLKRIQVRDTFSYLTAKDDWNTASKPFAPVPTLAFYAGSLKPQGGGKIFTCGPEVVDRDLATRYGPFADRDGTNTVEWTLPLPEPDLGFLPHTLGFDKYDEVTNRIFASSVRFDHGGGGLVAKNNKTFPRDNEHQQKNINMHCFLMGLHERSPNWYFLTSENRAKFRQRTVLRLYEPLETCLYKMVCRWRQEPGSGIRYTIYMKSPRDIVTRYRPETYGSKTIYGDSNETVRMILSCLQKLADQQGEYELVRANWDIIKRQVATYPLVLDDWGYMGSGCLEWGGACSIDMLNNEYSSLCSLARLAQIAGDEPMHLQALYRAARRIVPTLTRLNIKDYYVANGMLANADAYSISTGFGENGAVFRQKGSRVRDIDLFDMSQGIPQDLIALYDWYGYKELRENYLNEVGAADASKGMNYLMAAIYSLDPQSSPDKIKELLESCFQNQAYNKRLPRDWPGMNSGSYIEYALHRIVDSPSISDCRDLNLQDAVFDPATKTLTLKYLPGQVEPQIVVRSQRKLAPNQQGLSQDANGQVRLPAPKGKQTTITVQFQ